MLLNSIRVNATAVSHQLRSDTYGSEQSHRGSDSCLVRQIHIQRASITLGVWRRDSWTWRNDAPGPPGTGGLKPEDRDISRRIAVGRQEVMLRAGTVFWSRIVLQVVFPTSHGNVATRDRKTADSWNNRYQSQIAPRESRVRHVYSTVL